MPQSSSMQQRFFVWLSDNPGEAILRWIFRVAVTVTIAALAVDLAGMNGWGARPDPAVLLVHKRREDPLLAEELDDVPRELGPLVDLGGPGRDPLRLGTVQLPATARRERDHAPRAAALGKLDRE